MTPLVMRLLELSIHFDQCGMPNIAKTLTEAIKEIEKIPALEDYVHVCNELHAQGLVKGSVLQAVHELVRNERGD